ncbi:four-carbon acid sugar kinase family protein [Naasia sp. SYSU D00948]|uniref:four-carbon acid sugar kinase family protein n=1 Tax=Naasia sp. SYSU D00948 TaxID=2817379 RepID=UPI001B30D4BF|nr:four-carbon acid sugar kinase family protein [Naasia sp. SYSU D00948]
MPDLRVAFYGDDFTGSVDVLLQLTRAGWRSRLLLGLPDADRLVRAAADVDAVGIAGIARSLPTEALEAEVRPALEALRALGPRIVQYKACSTADSSPSIGSLGRVLEIARDVFGPATVPVLFAQPDFGRFTVFGHHFAAEGGVVHRLDRQPTMSHHPVTPMHESDLAVHLSRQTDLPLGHVPFPEYAHAGAVARRLEEATEAALVLDALSDAHVDLVAEAIAAGSPPGTPRFALGSGGLSAGLGRALRRPGDGAGPSAVPLNPPGPVLAVSGSRSPQTARQIEAAREAGWTVIPLSLGAADPVGGVRERVLAELASGRSVAVTTGDAVAGETAGAEGGPDLVATIARHLSELVRSALTAGTRRVIVCGGDTSSRVVGLLGAESLSIAANPVGNVVLCRVAAAAGWLDGAEMLLKGGQVGPADLFELVRTLGD